jgi:hypothetical protein
MLPFPRVLAFRRLRPAVAPLLGVAVAGLLLLGGCSGGPNGAAQIDTQQVRPMDEVAVVSVRTEKSYRNEIDRDPASEAEGVREAVHQIKEMSERQSRRADPDFDASAEQVRSYLFGPFRSAAPFALVEESPVLTSSAYQNFEPPSDPERDWQASLFAAPEGYRPLSAAALRKSTHLQTLIGALPAAPDGLLFAETEYALVRPDSGPQTRPANGDTVHATVEATVRVQVFDRTGGTALTVTQTGRADDGFTFVYGEGWTTEQIAPPSRRATRAALENTTRRLQKNLPGGAVAQLRGALPSPAASTSEAGDR